MPGMTERKRMMRGETKTARGDYGKKGYGHGGDVKKMGYGGEASKKMALGGVTSNQPTQVLSKMAPPTLGGPSKPPSVRNTKPRRPRKAVVRKQPVIRPTKADDRGL